MSSKNKSTLSFDVSLDENKVPEKIEWTTEDQETSACKAVMTSLWDEHEGNTLRIDLWTKEMTVEEMRHFFVQSMITMADTFERATNDVESAEEFRLFSKGFGKKLGVIKEDS